MIVFLIKFSCSIIGSVLISFSFYMLKLAFSNIYAYIKVYINLPFIYLHLFVDAQRWIGHGCTKYEGRRTISLENIGNSLNLQKRTQEVRRHREYIPHAKPARI
jgi:hypothetical protein